MKTLRYITAVAAIMALAACSNEDLDLGGYENDPDAVHINATVGDLVESRSNPITSSAFENGDKIKLSSEGRTGVYTYNANDDSGSWTFASGDYLRWNNLTQKFFAWFPEGYSGNEKVLSNQSSPEWGNEHYIGLSDYMYFEGDCEKPGQAPYTINLEMQRQTARVIIDGNFRHKNELEGLEGYTISVEISDGTTTVQTCLSNGNYYALLNPTTTVNAYKDFVTVTLHKDNDTRVYNVRGVPVLEKGYSYTYNVTIGKDRMEIGGVEVAPWTDGGVVDDDEHQAEEIE